MSAPDRNSARARAYRALARLFSPPMAETLGELSRHELPALAGALRALGAAMSLQEGAFALYEALSGLDPEELVAEWEANFEASGGLFCPLGETAHTTESSQEAWLKGYRLADIAGFYHAFGVEVTPGSEVPDHLAIELEFMHLLAVKEAVALEQGEVEGAGTCREAAISFMRDHLGRWGSKVHQRLEEGQGKVYPLAAAILEGFLALDKKLLEQAG